MKVEKKDDEKEPGGDDFIVVTKFPKAPRHALTLKEHFALLASEDQAAVAADIAKLAATAKDTADSLGKMSPAELAAKLDAAEMDSLRLSKGHDLTAAIAKQKELDADGDGEISKEEMRKGLEGVNQLNAIRATKLKIDALHCQQEYDNAEQAQKDAAAAAKEAEDAVTETQKVEASSVQEIQEGELEYNYQDAVYALQTVEMRFEKESAALAPELEKAEAATKKANLAMEDAIRQTEEAATIEADNAAFVTKKAEMLETAKKGGDAFEIKSAEAALKWWQAKLGDAKAEAAAAQNEAGKLMEASDAQNAKLRKLKSDMEATYAEDKAVCEAEVKKTLALLQAVLDKVKAARDARDTKIEHSLELKRAADAYLFKAKKEKDEVMLTLAAVEQDVIDAEETAMFHLALATSSLQDLAPTKYGSGDASKNKFAKNEAAMDAIDADGLGNHRSVIQVKGELVAAPNSHGMDLLGDPLATPPWGTPHAHLAGDPYRP